MIFVLRAGEELEGELAEPVREFTIASTIQKMLGDVVAVGSDLEWLPMSAAGVSLVIGFGPAAWDRLRGGRPAAPLRDFPGYRSADGAFTAPATQRDLWVWAHGATVDVVYDVIRGVAQALAPVAELQLDVTGFTYHDSRDLTGFIDGSANPYLDEAPAVAVIPDGEPGQGGCCAMTMRFRHDLDAFAALDEREQELVIGRTKPDSVELDDDVQHTRVDRLLRRVVDVLNPYYQIRSLREFNEKFQPEWQPRSLIYADPGDLPKVALRYAFLEGFVDVPLIGRLLSGPSEGGAIGPR